MKKLFSRALWVLFLASVALGLSGCASKGPREIMEERLSSARPRAAAYGADGFYEDMEFPQGDRPRPSEFFFKHCTLSGRNPYPSSSDWDCPELQ